MSVKKTIETTSSKILNSDIYDITRFVDDIKKRNIDGVDNKETLLVGMYGYLGYQFSSLLQNAIVTASELSNEAIPTRAKFDRNVITHALSLGVKKVAATPANMKVLLMFPEKALRANMIDGKFTFRAATPLLFDQFEFHTDYDITIHYTDLSDSTNGSMRNYVYTAQYDMTDKNPISDLDNPFLPPISVFNYNTDNMIVLSTNLHQVEYHEIYSKILSSDIIANKTISFSFDKQMSHFMVKVQEPDDNIVMLTPVYDGLYNQEIAEKKYCYYQYINSNTIRIRFDPTNYQPPENSDITIQLYITSGSEGNFEYSEEKTIRITSDKYTNLYCIIAQRGEDGSSGGLDRQDIEQLQHIIPKEALSRGSITTLTDLRNFFNSLNNENSVLHVFRKEDNILDRIYYVYNLMKDSERNIVPTNTIPIYMESTRRDTHNGKIYLESGTPIFYYKFGEGANQSLLRDNYIGYLQQKVANNETIYNFYNGDGLTTYQGTPTIKTLENWFASYKNSFDAEVDMGNDFEYSIPKPKLSYDFFENASIYFKAYHSEAVYNKMIPVYNPNNIEALDKYNKDNNTSLTMIDYNKLFSPYETWYYGNCRYCELKRAVFTVPMIIAKIKEQMNKKDLTGNYIVDFELEWTEGNDITHFPMRVDDSINPNGKYITVDEAGYPISIIQDKKDCLSAVRFYRRHHYNANGEISDVSDRCEFDLILSDDKNTIYVYAWIVNISFYDETKRMYIDQADNRPFLVSDYITNISDLDKENKKQFSERFFLDFMQPYIIGDGNILMLESINTIDVYSYNGQGEYGFSSLLLTEGDLIRFDTYRRVGSGVNNSFVYTDPTTWRLGEVLSIEKNNGRIVSIEVLIKDEKLGNFDTIRYRLPVPGVDDGVAGKKLDENCIVVLSKITKFLYTTPLSIILKDDPKINTHRITASYYLDIINETRYQTFDCINSKSPIQYILSSIHTYRSSYLSDNRYKYNIRINIKPNTGKIDANMINRTQVIGVFYKKGISETSKARPVIYSIAQYVGGDSLSNVNEDGIPYEINLYTRPFATSDKSDNENDRTDIIDDNNNVYIGPKKLIQDLSEEYEDEEELKRAFWDQYKLYYADANTPRPLEMPTNLDLERLDEYLVNTVYLNLNTELKIYILYKYDIINTAVYTDGLSREYLAINTANVDALYNSVSQNTMFTEVIPSDEDDEAKVKDYSLKQMVLTNVYSTYQGINLLHDYSNIMNSYVTAIKTNDIFNPTDELIESYIINRVPCVRYFYWNTEERVLTFIKDMKKKINYVLDAIDPLECTFGLDYKFFNTYGPSNMYRLTNDDGEVTELIDNVALTMTFRAKFYNEDSDADSIVSEIKNTIKDYLENLDQLDDIHFPNITTKIETDYAEYLIYFEFVSFNIYDATTQHIITVEDMEMLSMVPEFLHVDTNDWNGLPYINIRVVS